MSDNGIALGKSHKHVHTVPYPYLNGYLHLGHGLQVVKTGIRHTYLKNLIGYQSKFYMSFHASGIPIPVAVGKMLSGDKKITGEISKRADLKQKIIGVNSWLKHHILAGTKDLKNFNLGIDWTGTFTTTKYEPIYDSFVKWQYDKLYEMGYCINKKYPVIWCNNCKSVMGDHERAEGEGLKLAWKNLKIFSLKDKKIISFHKLTGVTPCYKCKINGAEYYVTKKTYENLKTVLNIKKLDEIKNLKIDDKVGKPKKIPYIPGRVICRCGGSAKVKIIEKQWFLKYSEPGWRKKIKAAILNLNTSKNVKKQLIKRYAILQDYPFGRNAGLGTHPNFDKTQIIGSLSDSTIYPFLHPLIQILRDSKIGPYKIDWDQIFGHSKPASEIYNTLNKIHRTQPASTWHMSGKDLVENHILFLIAHTIAIFPKSPLPQIKITGHVMALSGEKMSKSKGNSIYLYKIIHSSKNEIPGLKLNIALMEDSINDIKYNPANTIKYQKKILKIKNVKFEKKK